MADDLVQRKAPLTIREQAELVLRLPAPERLDFFLDAPKPMALVRAIPDGDFYLTVREVGPQDALPLLALAAPSQIAHLLDLESWRRDRFDSVRCGAWVALLAESGEDALRRFAHTIDDDTLILLFRTWARVHTLDIDHEEPTQGHGITETGDERGFISPDGGHLFSPEHEEHGIAARRLAEVLFLDDQPRYAGLIRSALFELPSEVEETALHWRNSRLEEHGYPTWDEALSIYAPPESAAPSPPAPDPADDPDALAAPRVALRVMAADTLIVPAIGELDAADRERVLFGLTALANRVLVADGADAGSVEAHKAVMERTGSYVSVALELRGVRDATSAASVLARVPAIELFREGYARAAALQIDARFMLKEGWGQGHVDADAVLDTPLRARVRGLTLARPLYVAMSEDGAAAPRDFRSIAELEETRVTLALCAALGLTLLQRRGVTVAELVDGKRGAFEDVPRFSILLLTALGWHATRGELRVDRLPTEIVADFLRTTASRRTADPEAPARGMTRLIDALSQESKLARRSEAALRVFGTTCLDRLAADCGGLDPGTPATPRTVGCLRLA